MKRFFAMRKFWTILALVLITAVSDVLLLVNSWLALAVFVALTVAFIYNAIRNVPAKPPHKAVLTFFGKRQKVVLDEGWRLLPFYPFVFGFILIKVEKVNYDLEPQQVRTPDRAVISITASVTWVPGIKGNPGSYIAYLNSGGEEGVKKIIHDVIEDRTKTWAGSNREGPSTWMEALALKDDAHEVLVKSLLGDTLVPVGSPIPTNTWMRFFDEPKSEPTEYDANPRNGWAEKKSTGDWNWNGLQAIYDGYSSSEKAELVKRVLQRRQDVRKIREGKGDFGDESLGITIVRFTVNEVKVEGAVAVAAELEEKERRERDADTMEIDNVSVRVQKLRQDHPEMSLAEAVRLVQTERGKVFKSVIEVLGAQTGLGQDLLGALGFQKLPSAGNPSGKPSGQGGQSQKGGKPAKSAEELAQEFADANNGQYPRWDPQQRKPQYNG